MDSRQYNRSIIAGDREVFREFTDTNVDLLYRLVFKLVGDSFEAQDIVQDTFIKLWEKRKTIKAENSLLNFTKRIAVNKSYDYLRKVKRKPRALELSEYDGALSDNNADRKIEESEYSGILDVLCNDLSAKQKLIFTLAAVEEMDAEEIRTITGLSKSRIKSNLYHARQSVKAKYRKLTQDE